MEKIIQNAQVTYRYSPSDMLLYMRSPFAAWMERFKVEQPAEAPGSSAEGSSYFYKKIGENDR